MAEKTVKAQSEKPSPVQKVAVKPVEKDKNQDKNREKPKQPNAIARWYRETIGELRKVSWPSTQDAWRLTRIVLLVMLLTSAFLGLMDFVFSRLITLLVS